MMPRSDASDSSLPWDLVIAMALLILEVQGRVCELGPLRCPACRGMYSWSKNLWLKCVIGADRDAAS
jgi:hypothetical protein